MKKLVLSLALCLLALGSFTTQAHAKKIKPVNGVPVAPASSTVKADALLAELKNVAFGLTELTLSASTPETMIEEIRDIENADAELVFDRTDWPGDEHSYGTFPTAWVLESRIGLDESSIDLDEEDAELKLKARVDRLNEILKDLAILGYTFGYTSTGYSYCGVVFTNLYIIDVKRKKIYEVHLGTSGSC